MTFELTPLPFSVGALAARGMCQETLELHHGKHHQGYVDKLNEEIRDQPPLRNRSLEELIQSTHEQPALHRVYENAGQVWNHDLFWQSLSPDGGSIPGPLAAKIQEDFGHLDRFRANFKDIAVSQFGSGWTWLVLDRQGRLRILGTANADSPLATGDGLALLVLDVWEHAYYLDHRNRRADYIDNFLDRLANFEGAAKRLQQAGL